MYVYMAIPTETFLNKVAWWHGSWQPRHYINTASGAQWMCPSVGPELSANGKTARLAQDVSYSSVVPLS
jgi:hypothetical protein